eukprot:7409342-Prorocentrum_lima.AAC.1
MVMEMQMKDGSWVAFMAEPFPENLDDEIKNLKDVLPAPLPMTHICEDEGTNHYGIARYPIDEWMALGEP